MNVHRADRSLKQVPLIIRGSSELFLDRIKDPRNEIPESYKQQLVPILIDLARKGFGTEVTEEDVTDHVLNVDILYLMSLEDEVVGFASYDELEILGKRVLYLSGIVVDPRHQKAGIFNRTNTDAIYSDGYDFLAMRTQNPVIYASTEALVDKLYPNCDEPPEEVQQIAEEIGFNHLGMSDFCKKSMIGKGTYGCCLYGEIPRHHRDDINQMFDNTLDYLKGDSRLLIGRLKDGN